MKPELQHRISLAGENNIVNQEKKESGSASIDFSQQPKTLKKYEGGEPVNRENFLSMFVQSFALSTGRIDKQVTYFLWLADHVGFDFDQTFCSLVIHGEWDAFTQEEKQIFLKRMNAVGKHRSTGFLDQSKSDEAKARDGIRGVVNIMSSHDEASKEDMQSAIAVAREANGKILAIDQFETFREKLLSV